MRRCGELREIRDDRRERCGCLLETTRVFKRELILQVGRREYQETFDAIHNGGA